MTITAAQNLFGVVQNYSTEDLVQRLTLPGLVPEVVDEYSKIELNPRRLPRIFIFSSMLIADRHTKLLTNTRSLGLIRNAPLLIHTVPGLKVLDAKGWRFSLSLTSFDGSLVEKTRLRQMTYSCPPLQNQGGLLKMNARGYGYDLLHRMAESMDGRQQSSLLLKVCEILNSQAQPRDLLTLAVPRKAKTSMQDLVAFLSLAQRLSPENQPLMYQQVHRASI